MSLDMNTDRPEYVIILRPKADASDPQGVRALRSLLKVALRRFGLRCIRCEKVETR